MFKKPIAISLSPNTQSEDVCKAFLVLKTPWMWKKGQSISKVDDWFKTYFKSSNAFSFNSGRAALYLLLKAFNVGVGDEVILQAFTCVAVPDPIKWVGAKPIFVDIDDGGEFKSFYLSGFVHPLSLGCLCNLLIV